MKAAREGKEQTSWLNPHDNYEAGLKTFIGRILDPAMSGEFLEFIAALGRRVALLGALNSISQLTLKATLPGVPDFYQGTEFWDLSLVDPDNRRPIDFAARAAALVSLRAPEWSALAQTWTDGRLKLAWTSHLLKLRSELADVFTFGDYQPLEVSGPHRDHVFAFARQHGRNAAIVAIARNLAAFSDGGRAWPSGETLDATLSLPGYAIEGIDTAELPLSTLFHVLPAVVLKAEFAAAEKPTRKRVATQA